MDNVHLFKRDYVASFFSFFRCIQKIRFLNLMVRNVRSRKILQEYEKIKPEEELTLRMPNGMSYREYIDRGICTYVDEEEGREVTRNESINVTVLHKVIEDIGAQLGALGVGVTEVGTINYRHIP